MNIKKYLWSIVEDNSIKKGKVLDFFIQVLIFSSLISFSIETLTYLPENSIFAYWENNSEYFTFKNYFNY